MKNVNDDPNTKTREAHDAYRSEPKGGRSRHRHRNLQVHIALHPLLLISTPTLGIDDRRISQVARDFFFDCYFVWNDVSDGWIEWHDLPGEKQRALLGSIAREIR